MIAHGNTALLKSNLAVVLNSSQSKTPCGDDGWIKASAKAAKYLIDNEFTLVTSLGLNTWEFIVYLVSRAKGTQVIVSPDIDDFGGRSIFEETVREFKLDQDKTAMVFAKSTAKSKSPKSNWLKRDQAAISMANTVLPVSIRPRGKMKRLIDEKLSGKQLVSRFGVEYSDPIASPPRYSPGDFKFKSDKWEYLTHWTRTCQGPWPGQSKYEYYESLISSGSKYPNDAFSTLSRIVEERLIRGSSKRIRESARVIGFTESHPAEVLSRMRWLPKRTGWNFEPYAVGIRKQTAIKHGIRPVFYGNSDDYEALPPESRPYFQSIGERNVDWRQEKEWRYSGDLDLSAIPPEDIVLPVRSESESKKLGKYLPFEVIALGGR